MGLYRFILSSLVVLFHMGSISTPSGYSAVFGFYLLSGYLIPLAIEKNYGLDAKGIARYYGNRILRIFPLYVLFLFLTTIVIFWYGGTTFYFNNKPAHVMPDIVKYEFIDLINELFLGIFAKIPIDSHALILNGFPQAVPQAWSLVVELIFYALAPLLLIFFKPNNIWGRILFYWILFSSLIFALYTNYVGLDFATYRYRSVFGSFFIFMVGFLTYIFRNRIPKTCRPKSIIIALVVTYTVFVIFVNRRVLVELQIYLALILQLFITAIGMTVNYKESHFDRKLGDLSYGIFVSHFFVALLMSVVTSDHGYWQPLRGAFGEHGTLLFGVWCLIFTIMASQLSHLCIESFIDRFRDKIRGHLAFNNP